MAQGIAEGPQQPATDPSLPPQDTSGSDSTAGGAGSDDVGSAPDADGVDGEPSADEAADDMEGGDGPDEMTDAGRANGSTSTCSM